MTEFRENLLTRMIHLYGMEDSLVIEFARLCEEWEDNDWNNFALEILVEAHEDCPAF